MRCAGLGTIAGCQVPNSRVGHIVTGTAEIHITVEFGLHELMTCIRVTVWAEFVGTGPHGCHATAVIAFGCRLAGCSGAAGVYRIIRAVCRERCVHDPCMLGIIGVGHGVAGIAIDTIGVTGCKAGSISRGRASTVPAAGAVATNAQVTCAIKVLFSNSHGCPEDRVAACIAHGGTAPARGRFVLRFTFTGCCRTCIVVTGMAIVALVR